MRLTRMSVGLGLILLIAIVAFAQKVTTDYDHAANFSKYKTFMWLKEPNTEDPLMKQRIIDAVNTELTEKGLQLVRDNADLNVAAHLSTRQKQTLNTFYDGYPGWGWGLGGTATTTVQTYEVGTLVVDLFDSGAKRVIWRGTATATVPDKPEKKEKKIEKALDKMFKDFPPNKKVTRY